MARGIPILAFDTYYYRDLSVSGAVETVPWLSTDAFAAAIKRHCKDRRLATMIERGIDFAKRNTQEIWLERRVKWTEEFCKLVRVPDGA